MYIKKYVHIRFPYLYGPPKYRYAARLKRLRFYAVYGYWVLRGI